MSTGKATTIDETIRNWVKKHRGHPAMVPTGTSGGVLRIGFDEPGGHDDGRLQRISWDEFFKIFNDDSDIAFLRGQGDSRFSKFVEKESANS